MAKLKLGPKLGDLGVDDVIPGRPWAAPARLRRRMPDRTRPVVAWPAAPVLEFPEISLEVTALLTEDEEFSVLDAVATFYLTGEQTALLRTGHDVYLSVNGATVYEGRVTCRS